MCSSDLVGVMAHLALYFARHSLWPEGSSGWPNPAALVFAAVAALLLLRLKWSIARTILACGACGVLAHALQGG